MKILRTIAALGAVFGLLSCASDPPPPVYPSTPPSGTYVAPAK